MNENETVIREAEFNPKVKTYWMLNGCLILFTTIIGIPLIPLWAIFGFPLMDRYLKRLRCALTDRSVILNKGLLVRVEKTVPLDKITDVGLVQGPIMRMFDIHAISFETAGQTSGMSATLGVIGVIDGKDFRNHVLKLRDEVTLGGHQAPRSAAATSSDVGTHSNDATLRQILDVLKQIEKKIGN